VDGEPKDIGVLEFQHWMIPGDDGFEFRVGLLESSENFAHRGLFHCVELLEVVIQRLESSRTLRAPAVEHEGIRMCSTETVFLSEEGDLLGVLPVRALLHLIEPVRHGLPVLLLDSWEVGGSIGTVFCHVKNLATTALHFPSLNRFCIKEPCDAPNADNVGDRLNGLRHTSGVSGQLWGCLGRC
jgi:hypothetical protein